MLSKIYSSRSQAWEAAEAYSHDGAAWAEISAAGRIRDHYYRSIFSPERYLGEGTILQRDVSAMPLDPRSEEMTATVEALAPFSPAGGYGTSTSLNTSSFGTQPIHAYLVDSRAEGHSTRRFEGAVATGTGPEETQVFMNGDIPAEPWMIPAQNHDRGLAIYDLGTGIMREYFMTVPVSPDRPEVWKGMGGYSMVRPGLGHLAEDNYALQQRRGLSNVAGMHNSFGFIGIHEALVKKIDHALCVTAAALRMRDDSGESPLAGKSLISWPSRGSDGKLENYLPGGPQYAQGKRWAGGTVTPTHGQWGRVDPDLDPMHNPKTGKPFNAFTRVVIEAAKKYGLVFTDTNLWTHAFNAEQGRTFAHFYGQDPWARGGIIHRQYISKYGEDGFSIADFPWWAVQWAPVDWGRPSPDFNLRPGQLAPWEREA